MSHAYRWRVSDSGKQDGKSDCSDREARRGVGDALHLASGVRTVTRVRGGGEKVIGKLGDDSVVRN